MRNVGRMCRKRKASVWGGCLHGWPRTGSRQGRRSEPRRATRAVDVNPFVAASTSLDVHTYAEPPRGVLGSSRGCQTIAWHCVLVTLIQLYVRRRLGQAHSLPPHTVLTSNPPVGPTCLPLLSTLCAPYPCVCVCVCVCGVHARVTGEFWRLRLANRHRPDARGDRSALVEHNGRGV